MKQPDMQAPYLKALFYGQPGSTKTRTAASAVFVDEFNPVLMLESAGNPLSIRDYDPQPTVLSIEKLKDFNQVYDFLSTGQPAKHTFRDQCERAGIPLEDYYRTVILDGTSQTQRDAFKVIITGADVPPGDVPNPHEIQHFNRVLDVMINWGDKFIRHLDMHVILTALEDEHNEKNGTTRVRPLLWGQSRSELCGYAYLVMRLAPIETIDTAGKGVIASDLATAKASDFVGFIRATSTFYAKDQYGMRDDDGKLMRYMFDPSIEKIWNRIVETA